MAFPPFSSKGDEKLVNRDIKNYPPHINLDRKSLRQFTFVVTNYLQVWSAITIIKVPVNNNNIIYKCMHICMKYIQVAWTCVHIYSIVHICARYINMCDLEINFIFDNQFVIQILNSHYATAAVPIW